MNKLEVNAALVSLVREEDIEKSARTVIAFAKTLKPGGKMSLEITLRGDKGSRFTGETPHGPLEVKSGQAPDKGIGFGASPEQRVGQFKLMLVGKGEIRFHHYWASDITTSTDLCNNIETYVLRFNPESEKMDLFGVMVPAKTWELFRFICIQVSVILPIVGKRPTWRGWRIILSSWDW